MSPADSPTDPVLGVWLVSYVYDGDDHVIPFPDEVEALRYVNEADSHRAWFVPFGANLHDVIRSRPESSR